jgi:hypothetical protein
MTIQLQKTLISRFWNRINFFVFLISLFFISNSAYSQCCSTGSPVGASVYVGVLQPKDLRVIAYYRHNYSDTYYEGSEKISEGNILKSSNYNFGGMAFGYGITKRLTAEVAFGYFFNKTQDFNYIDYQEKGYGLSNGAVTFKYGAFVKPAKQIELTLGLGFLYPFTTTPLSVDGVQLSRDVQPSTNAFSLTGLLFFNKGFEAASMRLFSINRYDYNFSDPSDYQYGAILMNSVFLSRKIIPYFFGILQLRSEYRWQDKDNSAIRPNTGNFILVLSPQLTYSIVKKWNVSVLCDIPVYKNYNGKQLTPKYSVAVALTRDISLAKKSKVFSTN